MESSKPFKTYSEQLSILCNRGLIVDLPNTENILSNVNYYRLNAYFQPYYQDVDNHQFVTNTKFSDIYSLYSFDKELRLLIFSAIEIIEIALRTKIAYYAGEQGGENYQNLHLYIHNQVEIERLFEKISIEIERSREPFVEHFRDNYEFIPIWAVVEVLSFGALHKLFALLNYSAIKVSGDFELNKQVLKNWIKFLVMTRNIIAHHGRLWNKKFTLNAMNPRGNNIFTHIDKFETVLKICDYLLVHIEPKFDINIELHKLLQRYPNVDIEQMGLKDF